MELLTHQRLSAETAPRPHVPWGDQEDCASAAAFDEKLK